MPNKLTDIEIFKTEIKCVNRRANGQCNGGTDCCNCNLLMNEKDIISAYERAIANIDLINRQEEEKQNLEIELQAMRGAANSYKAEVERLKAYYKDEFEKLAITYTELLASKTQEIKAEAYKECLDELARRLGYTFLCKHSCVLDIMENRLNELVGDTDGKKL